MRTQPTVNELALLSGVIISIFDWETRAKEEENELWSLKNLKSSYMTLTNKVMELLGWCLSIS